MLQRSERVSFVVRAKGKLLVGTVLALTLLVMAGWMYFLGSIFVKFVLWLVS